MNKVYRVGFDNSLYEADQDWIISRNMGEAIDLFYELHGFSYGGARDVYRLECGFCIEPVPVSTLLTVRLNDGTVSVKKVEDHASDAISHGAVVPFLLKREKSHRMYLVGDMMDATHIIIARYAEQALDLYYELMGPEEVARVWKSYEGASETEFMECFVQDIPGDWHVKFPTDKGTRTTLVGEVVYEAVRDEEKLPKLLGRLSEPMAPHYAIPVPCLMCGEEAITSANPRDK